MRFSLSLAAFAAVGAYALPQDVQPISQISDGQIQAPPATTVVVPSSSPLYTATVTGSFFSESVVPSSPLYTATVTGSTVVVVPSSPAGGNTTVVVPSPSAPSGSGSATPSTPGASKSPSASGSPIQSPSPSTSAPPSAAAANAFSFTGLVLAVLGAVLV